MKATMNISEHFIAYTFSGTQSGAIDTFRGPQSGVIDTVGGSQSGLIDFFSAALSHYLANIGRKVPGIKMPLCPRRF